MGIGNGDVEGRLEGVEMVWRYRILLCWMLSVLNALIDALRGIWVTDEREMPFRE